jgi:3-hydroxyacyl-CoA dehydrogenase
MLKPFRTAAVLGAGIMGSQIAAHLANAGLRVYLLDLPSPQNGKTGDRNALVTKAFKQAQKLSPPIFFSEKEIHRIQLGNYEDDFYRLAEVDWIIEAVIEDLAIKQQLMARLDGLVKADAVVSTNTSGLSIHKIVEGRTAQFQKRFLGTHFFNPPRYLKLLELIPTEETDISLLAHMVWFGREYLGKGIVLAKDTPNFVANRIGLFMTCLGLQALDQGYSIEEVDTLTGPLVGRPKSATFRTADLVGLDTLQKVSAHLYQAIPTDEQREIFAPSSLLNTLVTAGALGAKTGKGFYQKVKGKDDNSLILSVNPASLVYELPKEINLPGLETIATHPNLAERCRNLYQLSGRAGDLFRQMTWALLSYSACRLLEIADSPTEIDQAMRWGFGWQMGPFELWDAIGMNTVLADLHQQGVALPEWIEDMGTHNSRFYAVEGVETSESVIDGLTDSLMNGVTNSPGPTHGLTDMLTSGFTAQTLQAEVPGFNKELSLAKLKQLPDSLIWQNSESALLEIGDGVALFEFRSKGNTLSNQVIAGLEQSLDRIEAGHYHGLVIGNDSEHFCGGANLVEMGQMAQQSEAETLAKPEESIAHLITHFQSLLERVHHFHKPIVAAVRGRALGGGCELVMACPQVVAAAESYIGLVEMGVGLIPGAGGIMRLVERASDRIAFLGNHTASDEASHLQPFITQAFQTVALAKVSTSAPEAQQMGYLLPTARIIMNSDHRLYVAKEEVLRLSHEGYRPLSDRHDIWVLGQPGRAVLTHMAYILEQSGYASEYDRYLASRLAFVMTGGDLSGPTRVSADYLLQLERENFIPLLRQPKTQARMAHLLKYKKPLRN